MTKAKSLEQLLAEVDKAFDLGKKPSNQTFVYSIGTIYNGWQFNVTDNWYRWADLDLKHDFNGKTAAACIQAFLDYIKENKINPASLRRPWGM